MAARDVSGGLPLDADPVGGAYRLLFEHNPLPMWVFDRESLRFLAVNEAAVVAYGYSRDQFAKMTILDIRPAEDRAPVRRDVGRVVGYDPPREWRHLRADGSVRSVEISAHDVEIHGRPARLVLAHDVTERKRAEAERERSFRRLERLAQRLETLHAIDQSILAAEHPREIADAAARRIADVVDGCASARVVMVEGGAPAPGAAADAVRIPLREGGAAIGFLELRADRPGALDDEALEMAREVADQVAIAVEQARLREAVERHATALEETVAERTRELRETNADLEAFAYSVSHDLRSPLRAMSGFAHALVEDHGARLDEDGRRMAERIVAAAVRMDALIGDLLEYSRVSRREMEIEPVPLDDIVAKALARIQSELADAEVEVDPGLGVAAGHAATLVQVVSNLVSNAVKFTPAERRPGVRIAADAEGETVTLRIEDRGIGIPPEHRERIFHVFERLHDRDRFPGTGVGLAIVRRGVERMGGTVEVESTSGEGSVFRVTLPAAIA